MRSTHFEEPSSEGPVRIKLSKASSSDGKRSKADRKSAKKR